MKKILIVLALLASVQVANAQGGAAVKKALDAAIEASQNAKKATKVATWTKLAETYLDAYNAPSANVWIGGTENELKLALGNDKASSTETVELGGEQYVKHVHADKNLYYNSKGQLEIIEVTKPIVENALPKALEAYKKAYELDTKATKTKDIAAGIKNIVSKFNNEAYNAYTFGNLALAERMFENAFSASSQQPSAAIDTSALYNAGWTAFAAENYGKAKVLLEQCLNYGYYAKDGEAYVKLADCVAKLDTTAAGKALQKDYLEKGFVKFPQSQGLLIGLINYYINSGEDTDRLFSLIDDAKKNEPNNASLYYVEGNINSKLGKIDEAIAAYEKCAVIDPTYEYGYIGEGLMFYNQASELVEKAQNEMDDTKYMALVQQFEKALKGCIDPFEKAYQISKDESIKSSIAEYLKNAYYRFRDEDAKYMAGYEKYSKILNN